MLADELRKEDGSPYMYGSAGSASTSEDEGQRLYELNQLINPETTRLMNKGLAITFGKRILELGPGTGALATAVLNMAPQAEEFIAVDQSREHCQLTEQAIKDIPIPRKSTQQLDLLTQLDELKELGNFDLIYCRWLLVHLPHQARIALMASIYEMLIPGGQFICEECDNSDVKYQMIDKSDSEECQQATRAWRDISAKLMKNLGTDYQLSIEKLTEQMTQASDKRGTVTQLGSHTIVLNTPAQKRVIPIGYRTGNALSIAGMDEKKREDTLGLFSRLADNKEVSVTFLTEHVMALQKPKL